MNKAKVIIAIAILIAGFLGYAIGKHSTPITQKTNTQLNLPYEEVKVSGADSVQQKQIEDFIATFYTYKQQKDVNKLLGLFTQPTTNADKNDLKFILGTDGPPNVKPLSRLYTTQGYAHATPGYYLREISVERGDIRVVVDEMRTFYSVGEYVGYTASITNAIFELKDINTGLKISQYYHQSYDGAHKKYEGFLAY